MTGASNVTGCEPCKTDVGEYSPAGSGYCLSCTSGTYYDEEQNACFDCPVGRFTATGGIGLSGCEFCPEGFYSSTTGSPTCFACQPGKYVNALNSTCVECEPGHFSGVASSSCSACEQGKFADGVGNAECTKCPDFQTSEKGSSACVCKKTFKTINRDSSELECTCDPGMMLDNGVCMPCATGFFKSSTSLEGCKNCDKHAIKGAIQSYKGPIESSEPANSPLSCICSKGEFRSLKSNETLIGSCQSCPEGTKCDHAGVTMRDLPINRGYWRSNFTSSNIVKCYIKQACPQSPSTKTINSTNPIDEQCADGHTGPICNLCLQGYAKDVLGNCITCEDDRFHVPTETAAILVTLGVVFIASVYFYKRKKKESRDRLQEFRERKSESSTTSRVTNSLVAAQVNRDHWFYRVRTKGKIMLSFSQILTSFEGVLEVRFPSIFENFMRMISSVANLDAIQLARIDCLVSLFFTLLASLLTKVEIDKTDDYNELIFGYMLIVVNCSSVALLILSQLSKPIHFWFGAVVGKQHRHEGSLRGMNKEQTSDRAGFIEHWLKVAMSSVDEAGWELYTRRSEKWTQFLDYSGATVERRCSTGNGPIDEMRAVFVIDYCDFNKVKNWVLNNEKDLRHGVIECHDVGGKNKNIEYLARKMKGIYSDRDYLVEHFEGTALDGAWYCVKRSVDDKELYTLKKSHSQGRVRAEVVYEGWLVYDLGEGEGVRVTFLENVNPGGILKGLIINKTFPKLLRDRIDDLLAHLEEENVHGLFGTFGEVGEEEGVEMKVVTNRMLGGLVLGGSEGSGGSGSSRVRNPKNPLLLSMDKLDIRANSKGLLDVRKGGGGSGGKTATKSGGTIDGVEKKDGVVGVAEGLEKKKKKKEKEKEKKKEKKEEKKKVEQEVDAMTPLPTEQLPSSPRRLERTESEEDMLAFIWSTGKYENQEPKED
ncbi:hypothetical protein TrVE_jg9031 [Triparma verrucosa]|uniref:START domain-containing protein n=1 Tax=Triparma verrucosa TaxID=1606542 RepID=A0A9W7F408_9STRA|nr:hypothetical protein TrVE_jg9031 [Triparma verrucosa]